MYHNIPREKRQALNGEQLLLIAKTKSIIIKYSPVNFPSFLPNVQTLDLLRFLQQN